MPFSEGTEVKVKALTDRDWEVLQTLGYQGKTQHFTVPLAMDTDFASVPRPVVWMIPQYGAYTKAAILHDYLWRHAVPDGELTLADADGIFLRALRELEVPFLERWFMWTAVRLGAIVQEGGRDKWLRNSWRVFPVLILALPIAGPAAVLIVTSLGVFFALEWLLYLPLRLGRKVHRVSGGRVKQVNEPSLDMKLS